MGRYVITPESPPCASGSVGGSWRLSSPSGSCGPGRRGGRRNVTVLKTDLPSGGRTLLHRPRSADAPGGARGRGESYLQKRGSKDEWGCRGEEPGSNAAVHTSSTVGSTLRTEMLMGGHDSVPRIPRRPGRISRTRRANRSEGHLTGPRRPAAVRRPGVAGGAVRGAGAVGGAPRRRGAVCPSCTGGRARRASGARPGRRAGKPGRRAGKAWNVNHWYDYVSGARAYPGRGRAFGAVIHDGGGAVSGTARTAPGRHGLVAARRV